MLSAVSMAFSKAHVTMIERMVTPFRSRWNTLPLDTSRPTHRWASLTTWICALNLGTNRRVMDNTKDSAGITRPNR